MNHEKKGTLELSLPEETIAQLRERKVTALTIQEADRVWVKTPYRFGTSFIKDINDIIGGGGSVPLDDVHPTEDDPFADYLRRLYFRTDISENVIDHLDPFTQLVAWHLGAGIDNPLVQQGLIAVLDTMTIDRKEAINPTTSLMEDYDLVYHNRKRIKGDGVDDPTWPEIVWPLWNSFIYFGNQLEVPSRPVLFVSPCKYELVSVFHPRPHWIHGLVTPLIWWQNDAPLDTLDCKPAQSGSGSIIVCSSTYSANDIAALPDDHPIWCWLHVAHFDPSTETLTKVLPPFRDDAWHFIRNMMDFQRADAIGMVAPFDGTFQAGAGLVGCNGTSIITKEWAVSNGVIVFEDDPYTHHDIYRLLPEDRGGINVTIVSEQAADRYLGVSDQGVAQLSSSTNGSWRVSGQPGTAYLGLRNNDVYSDTRCLGYDDDNRGWWLVQNGDSMRGYLVGFFKSDTNE